MTLTRGLVLPLSDAQIVTRWLYLAGLRKLSDLDDGVRKDGAPEICPSIYYLMDVEIDGKTYHHNGGKDPTAPDPADRWSKPGSTFVNRTCDCVGAVAWGGGWDRYQRERFAHVYDGWINTDSMRIDAHGEARCFRRIDRPEPGAIIVYASDKLHQSHGVPVGHCGGITGYHRAEWEPSDPECWNAIEVVNVANYKEHDQPAQANRLTTGRGWFNHDAWFLRSIMQP